MNSVSSENCGQSSTIHTHTHTHTHTPLQFLFTLGRDIGQSLNSVRDTKAITDDIKTASLPENERHPAIKARKALVSMLDVYDFAVTTMPYCSYL